ncbi:Uncharacterised protein [Clostridioides difficile]|nr:Uncharacterised protein [Clostridioides difficile]
MAAPIPPPNVKTAAARPVHSPLLFESSVLASIEYVAGAAIPSTAPCNTYKLPAVKFVSTNT